MIKKPNELRFEDKKFSVIIAGVPGIGKTTTALSAPKPLLIDIDNGVSRIEARHRTDTLVANDYEELIADLKNADLSKYETLVVDTGGKLLDFLKPVVIKENPKNAKRDGSLSLNGYGAVKKLFADFNDYIRSLNKHLVMIFHASEVKLENDLTGLRIRIEGSSRDDVWDDMDLGGFIEMRGKKRTINFSNNERFYAKSTHGIHGVYEIPDLSDRKLRNTFLTDLFDKIKEQLKVDAELYDNYQKTMKLKYYIEKVANVDDLNKMYSKVKDSEHYLTSKEELWQALNLRAKELGSEYVKEQNQFS